MDTATGWRKRQIEDLKPKTADEFYNELRNKVIEEVATHIQKVRGDTPALFAVYVREMKSQQPEQNQFSPDWDTQSALAEEVQRMAKRITELEERNFCQRCGKRLFDGSIHTCTPPLDKHESNI